MRFESRHRQILFTVNWKENMKIKNKKETAYQTNIRFIKRDRLLEMDHSLVIRYYHCGNWTRVAQFNKGIISYWATYLSAPLICLFTSWPFEDGSNKASPYFVFTRSTTFKVRSLSMGGTAVWTGKALYAQKKELKPKRGGWEGAGGEWRSSYCGSKRWMFDGAWVELLPNGLWLSHSW